MSQDNFGIVRIRKADKVILEAMAKGQGRSVINMLSVLIAKAQAKPLVVHDAEVGVVVQQQDEDGTITKAELVEVSLPKKITGWKDSLGAAVCSGDKIRLGVDDEDMYTTWYEWTVVWCSRHHRWEFDFKHLPLSNYGDGGELYGVIIGKEVV